MEPPRPENYFGRIVLVNLLLVLLLFGAQRLLEFPRNGLMLLLLVQAFINGLMAMSYAGQKSKNDNNLAAHLLAAIVIAIIGCGQCSVNLGVN